VVAEQLLVQAQVLLFGKDGIVVLQAVLVEQSLIANKLSMVVQ